MLIQQSYCAIVLQSSIKVFILQELVIINIMSHEDLEKLLLKVYKFIFFV